MRAAIVKAEIIVAICFFFFLDIMDFISWMLVIYNKLQWHIMLAQTTKKGWGGGESGLEPLVVRRMTKSLSLIRFSLKRPCYKI